MSTAPSLVRHVTQNDIGLLADWRWIVPDALEPLFITALGDWIFGAPDGSLWLLEMIEGSLGRIAANGAEYNRLKASEEWLNETLMAGWFVVALGNGLAPTENQCIGWKIHPLLGGAFDKANLQLFDMTVYQVIMGQLHRQLRGG
jgi:hypothetical protein